MRVNKRQFLHGSSALMAATLAGRWLPFSPAHAGEHAMSHISAPLVLRKADNLPQKEILAWLKALRGHPYVAQSGFDVTAVFKVNTPEGIHYIGGVNVENRELSVGTCGEEGAIVAAVTAFGQRVDIIEGWLMGAPSGAETSDLACYPCGECRQRIAQYAAVDTPFHVMGLNGKELDIKTRGELLPDAFSFRDLPDNGEASTAPVLAEVRHTESRLYREPQEALTQQQVFDWLRGLRADVRVSHYNEMSVWRLANGAYVAGVKVENAAYPSSTNVMSTVAAVMNARYGKQPVKEVWAYGFHNDGAGQGADDYYMPSGASLQVLHQFASAGSMKLHCFNSAGMVKSVSLNERLTIAPFFSG